MFQNKYHSIVIVAALATVCGLAVAGDLPEKNQDQREIRRDKKELKAAAATFERLSRAVDRWVEANLTGHDKKAHSFEESILEEIQADIASSRRQFERYEAEVRSSAKEYNSLHQSRAARRDDRADLRDDIKDLHLARRLLKEKERLASSLRKVASFSNKYRLLGDYLEVMRRELGMARVELAEDVNERREDRVEGPRR